MAVTGTISSVTPAAAPQPAARKSRPEFHRRRGPFTDR
jgi:hypothetical protein